MTDKELKAEYERIQAMHWLVLTQDDFDRWFEGRKPLPPFDEWKSSLTR